MILKVISALLGGGLILLCIFLTISECRDLFRKKSLKKETSLPYSSFVSILMALAFILVGGILLTMDFGLFPSAICDIAALGLLVVLIVYVVFCLFPPKKIHIFDNPKEYLTAIEASFIAADLVLLFNYGIKMLGIRFVITTLVFFTILRLCFVLKNRKKKGWKKMLLFWEMFFFCASMLATINGCVGVRKTGTKELRIIEKSIGSRVGYYAKVESGKNYFMQEETWDKLRTGGTLTVVTYEGILGFEWIEIEA